MRIKIEKHIVIIGFLLFLCMFHIASVSASIVTTKHNLSRSGPGNVKALTDERICVFCHTPHSGASSVDGIHIPMWNHTLSTASYQLFRSPTLLSPTSPSIQPDGSARLCLSCHDGTVAIGSVIHGAGGGLIAMQGVGLNGEMPAGSSNYGIDLRGSHPISIEINDELIMDKAQQCNSGRSAFKVCRPPLNSLIKLEKTSNLYGTNHSGEGVQCSSCHDPHNDPQPGTTVFLRTGDRNNHDQICEACHSYNCPAPCP